MNLVLPYHEPPRTTLYFASLEPAGFSWPPVSYPPNQSAHHSQTLPDISRSPSEVLPFGNKPTGVGCPTALSKFAREASGGALPQGYLRPSGPLAARSHSASVGNRPPAHAQNAAASNQLTPTTGRFGYAFCRSQSLGSLNSSNPPSTQCLRVR